MSARCWADNQIDIDYMMTLLPLLFLVGRIGATEIILLVAIFVILFGAKKIPELMRGVGRGVKEFKDAVNSDYSAELKGEEPKAEEKKEE